MTLSHRDEFDYFINDTILEAFKFKDGEELRLAKVLLKTVENCRDFYIGFFGRNRLLIDDLLDYREKRLSLEEMSLYKFLWLCDGEINRDVFEQVFLQPFDVDDIFLIEEAVIEGRTTLEEIYNSFQKNPNENILKNVL